MQNAARLPGGGDIGFGSLCSLKRKKMPADKVPSVVQTAVTNIAMVLTWALAGVIVARILGPRNRGIYTITTAAPLFMCVVGSLGLQDAVVYVVNRIDGTERIGGMVWGSLMLTLGLGSLASAISTVFQLLMFWSQELGVSEVLFIAIACLPLPTLLGQLAFGLLRAQGRYTLWNLLRVLVPILDLTAVAAFAELAGLTVNAAIIALFASTAIVAVVSVAVIAAPHHLSTSGEDVRSLLSYGWKTHVVTVQDYANKQLDQVFLAAMVPPAQVGQYAIAATYASAGMALGWAPVFQLYSHFSRQRRPDRDAYLRLLRRTLMLLVIICSVCAAALPYFVPLVFGKQYNLVTVPALILIASSPMTFISAMLSAVWQSAGKPLIAARAHGVGLVVTVATLWFAIKLFGIDGAAMVSVVAYSVVAWWLWRSDPFERLKDPEIAQSYSGDDRASETGFTQRQEPQPDAADGATWRRQRGTPTAELASRRVNRGSNRQGLGRRFCPVFHCTPSLVRLTSGKRRVVSRVTRAIRLKTAARSPPSSSRWLAETTGHYGR